MYRRSGIGIFNMANDPTCGLFQGGIFQARCWAEVQNGNIVPGQSTNVEDSSFTLPPAPPPVAPPVDLTLTGDEIIDAQIAAQHAAYVKSVQDWAASQQAASKASDPNAPDSSGINWLIVGGAVVGVVFLFSMVGGRH